MENQQIEKFKLITTMKLPVQALIMLVTCGLSQMSQHAFSQEIKITDSAKLEKDLKGADVVFDSTKAWKVGSILNVNFSQVYLNNWLAGGQNSLTLTSISNTYANYQKGNVLWKNILELGYGLTKLKDISTRKSDDRITIISNYSVGKSPKLKYSALVDFRTQFAAGYAYTIDKKTNQEVQTYISDFLAPGYLITGLGFDYLPNKNISIFLSPLTCKSTIVANDYLSSIGAFGVKKGNKFRSELGAFVSAKFNMDVMKNINFKSNLNLFSNYKHMSEVDVMWENLLSMKVNKWVVVTFSNQLFYDDDVRILSPNESAVKALGEDPAGSPKVQYKQVLNVGLSFLLK